MSCLFFSPPRQFVFHNGLKCADMEVRSDVRETERERESATGLSLLKAWVNGTKSTKKVRPRQWRYSW